MEISRVYFVGNDGLTIYPSPDNPIKISYKFYMKRKWWQFWKPKWIVMGEPVFIKPDKL